MRDRQTAKNIMLIGLGIVLVTILHYFTVSTRWDIHDFYRRLYYIPIIMAAFKFRLKGGISTSLIISILYAPHLLFYFGAVNIAVLNQMLEIVMFIIIGTVTGFLVEADHSKKKLLEIQIRKLTDLENFTQNILDSITNVFIAVDKDLRIQTFNMEGRRLLGLDDTILGRPVVSMFSNSDEIKTFLTDALAYNRRMPGTETACNTADGRSIYVKTYSYPLKNHIGKVEGLVLVLEDVSELRKLENQVRRADKLSAVGVLASGIAHEIRNPLGIIKAVAQTVNKEIQDDDTKEGIGIIVQEVDRANSVIKNLLDFARPNIGNIKTYRLNSLIEDILRITKKYAEQNGVDIVWKALGEVYVRADDGKIRQAFVNIIFNSIQAMPDGGSLKIILMEEEGTAKVTFSDNGAGIPEDRLEKIFEPFFTTKDSGTGLGLAITHRIIEEHKGYIEVESTVGKGTAVSIYLPSQPGEAVSFEQENSNSG